ncbi:DUF3987 domain-containing protein [Lysinibacillus sp. BW-2-10]|uniref:DUF3987 domain-containing protein n=1 Tax=Lysinibacillus sp. BW-2-10 TaxID=2590030 RepID=UPI00117FC171|nr:DUF3987 domain-containing protein [Lysinibacillus sp. BW-2-10]TSI07653.1 DUF3987 domain-containing protein [Lysinibacillus sp. BW-2-10]
MVTQLLRIAALLHATSHTATTGFIDNVPITISKNTLAAAMQFKDYFVAYKEKVYNMINQH